MTHLFDHHHSDNQQSGRPVKRSANSICRAVGHDWKKTTVTNYRQCQREGCHAAERLVRGRWCEVPVPGRPQAKPHAQQPTLFRPGVDFYDRDEERRAERAYYSLLGR